MTELKPTTHWERQAHKRLLEATELARGAVTSKILFEFAKESQEFLPRLVTHVECLETEKAVACLEWNAKVEDLESEVRRLRTRELSLDASLAAEECEVAALHAELKRMRKAVLHFGQACWDEPVDLEGLLEESDRL